MSWLLWIVLNEHRGACIFFNESFVPIHAREWDFSTSSPAFVICWLVSDGHSDRCEVVPHHSFGCISLKLVMLSSFSCACWPSESVTALQRKKGRRAPEVILFALSAKWESWLESLRRKCVMPPRAGLTPTRASVYLKLLFCHLILLIFMVSDIQRWFCFTDEDTFHQKA